MAIIQTIIVGIDVGTQKTRVLVSRLSKESPVPVVIGMGTSDTYGMRHGYIEDIGLTVKSIKRAVNDAEKQSGISIRKAYLSIGGATLSTIVGVGNTIASRSDGEVTNFDIEKAIKESENALTLANKRVLYSIPLEYKLDGKEVPGNPEGMRGVKLEVKALFVTGFTRHVDDLEAALLELGIEVQDIVPAPILLSRVALSSKQKAVGVGIVDIGAESLSLAVFENSRLSGLHIFSIGSNDITNDIALGLRVALEEAEHIKLGVVTQANFPKKKIDDVVIARLGDMFELVQSYLKKMKRNELLPAGIILAGSGSLVPNSIETAKEYLKLPTKQIILTMQTEDRGVVRDISWAVAYGACLYGAQEESSNHRNSQKTFWQKIVGVFSPITKHLIP